MTITDRKPIAGGKQVLTYVGYKDPKRTQVTIPGTVEFKHLTGLQGKAIEKRYKEFQRSNIADFLGYPLYGQTGADPEIFVNAGDGSLLPSFKFLPDKAHGIKKKPVPSSGGTLCESYWDGFQAEMAIGAHSCLGWVIDSLQAGLHSIIEQARKVDPKAKLSSKVLIEVPLEVLKATESQYTEFGCKPSFNAYGLKGNLENSKEITYRSSGGHIHFGFAAGKPGFAKDMELVTKIVKSLDAVLAVGCVSMFAEFDHPLRRQFYGLAGEYRLPPHGLEYRTLSNAWIFHPFISNLVIDLARKVCNFGANGLLATYWEISEAETIETITNCDVKNARKIIDQHKGIYEAMFKACYGNYNSDCTKACYWALTKGMESVIKDPTDIERNWMINAGIGNTTWQHHSDSPLGKNVHIGAPIIMAGKKL